MMVNKESPCHICLLGRLEVMGSGKPLDNTHRTGFKANKANKANKALAYLILKRGQPVTAEELAYVSGIDPDGENVVGTLRVLIYRIRKRLSEWDPEGHVCIESTLSGYAWNMNCGIRVDLFEAESLCERVTFAKKLSSLGACGTADFLDLCGLELLPRMREETWAETPRQRFRNLHGAAMSHMLGLMWKAGDAGQIISTCHLGLANDPVNVLLWRHLVRAMKGVDWQAGSHSDALAALARLAERGQARSAAL